ncbi:hypothetical protein PPTG_24787 [Phytophthora nicotianae INRA-310]|uniref:Uncharacterized protein n=1 Tax=Phytophthora nicotianae (strain INRA-310) TaxID=761204 RepID=W2PD33_PHYN3|nr:hypothetical protein PPTG_24787 [Phytophthora nicotianae INRA-310]ETM97914.1 hypothetical protein PPTG_24787 [Phytophthora nicotianae INRA-310]
MAGIRSPQESLQPYCCTSLEPTSLLYFSALFSSPTVVYVPLEPRTTSWYRACLPLLCGFLNVHPPAVFSID